MRKPFKIKLINQELSAIIQTRLFALGYEWRMLSQVVSEAPIQRYGDLATIVIDNDGKHFGFANISFIPTGCNRKFVTVEELFQMKIEKKVEVKLNTEYKAEVTKEGVKLGYTEFPLSVIDELYKAKQEVEKD